VTPATTSILGRLERLGRSLENIALVGLLGLLIGVGVTEIVLREGFGTGISWADEVNRLIVLWLAMIAAIAASRENRHIRIDALGHVFSDKVLRITRIFVDVFAAGVCFVITWHAYRYLQLEIEFEDTVLFDTPAWIAHSIVPIAFALTGYRFLVAAAQRVVGRIDEEADRQPI
jgi:TRAP-type C4-dicarboxylate transport system permease small subunit